MTTCSKRFDRLLQAASLGLVGMLAIAGCGGSSSNPSVDAKQSGDGGGNVNAPDGGLAAGSLTVDQATLNFGSVDQGSSATKMVTVTNLGPTVALSPSVSGAGFVLQGTTCASVAKNGTCTITVAFSPSGTGGAPGVLTVAPGFTITLSGVGTTPGTFTASLSAVPLTALLGQAVPVNVTVVASTALTDLSCIYSGPDLTADTADTTCTAAVAAGAPCVYAFTFKGAKAGPAADTITCSSSGKVQNLPVTLTVLSPAALAINPSPGAFATVVGTTSSPITFKATNNGTAPSGALTVALTGAGAAQFAITDNECGAPVAGGANCTVTVVFKPIASGSVTASLTVTDATAGSTPATAVLNGTGAAAAALAISGAATLNSVTVGQSGTASTYTVTNNGGTNSAALKISAADAQFAIGSDLCTGLPLAAGKTCTFTVTFTPTSAGAKTTVLLASDGTMSGTLQISATGVAVAAGAALSLTPPTLDFGTLGVGLSSPPQTFTVTNTGGTASGVLSVVKNDSTSSVGGAAQFTYTTTCTAALALNATCQVVVTFSPTVAGNASATITVTDGTVSSTPHTIVGTALSRPGLTVSCASTTAADTVVGQTSAPITCTAGNGTNSSQATGALTASITGDFAITTNNCTASLAPGLSCTLSVVFKPTVKGARAGTVTVAGANGGAGNYNLSGTGL
ncbi:MAG: choice-of-anchor D domain-containing protein, partial [Polyangia bacterium]